MFLVGKIIKKGFLESLQYCQINKGMQLNARFAFVPRKQAGDSLNKYSKMIRYS
jgi:hypothetical protein